MEEKLHRETIVPLPPQGHPHLQGVHNTPVEGLGSLGRLYEREGRQYRHANRIVPKSHVWSLRDRRAANVSRAELNGASIMSDCFFLPSVSRFPPSLCPPRPRVPAEQRITAYSAAAANDYGGREGGRPSRKFAFPAPTPAPVHAKLRRSRTFNLRMEER